MKATEKQIEYLKSLIKGSNLDPTDMNTRQLTTNSFYKWQDQKYGKPDMKTLSPEEKQAIRPMLPKISRLKRKNSITDYN